MKKRIALGLLLAATPALAKDVWTYWGADKSSPDRAGLNFGEPDSEESTAHFGCKPHSGRIEFFLGETSEKLRPNKPMKATLTLGGARLEVVGKTLPNELAGVPSFQGAIDAADPFFEKLAGAKALAVAVGPARESLPLAGLGDKAEKFLKACAKP